jgi:hypothetical protein
MFKIVNTEKEVKTMGVDKEINPAVGKLFSETNLKIETPDTYQSLKQLSKLRCLAPTIETPLDCSERHENWSHYSLSQKQVFSRKKQLHHTEEKPKLRYKWQQQGRRLR